MNEAQKGILEEARANVRSLAQLASWQLALAHEVEGRLVDLVSLEGTSLRQREDAAKRRAGTKSRRGRGRAAAPKPR